MRKLHIIIIYFVLFAIVSEHLDENCISNFLGLSFMNCDHLLPIIKHR